MNISNLLMVLRTFEGSLENNFFEKFQITPCELCFWSTFTGAGLQLSLKTMSTIAAFSEGKNYVSNMGNFVT